jgi:hypothetical protein
MSNKPSPDDILTATQASEYAHVVKQAIIRAIYAGRLKAWKSKESKWLMYRKSIDEYRETKYNRDDKTVDGERIFDAEKGFFSVPQIEKVISHELQRAFSRNRLYRMIYSGELKARKRGNSWVVHKDDAIEIIKKERQVDLLTIPLPGMNLF